MSQVPWDQLHIDDLLALEALGPGRWRSRVGDPNLNGRSYGGQLLGQALRAALMDVPPGREATVMQVLFLQGAMPREPVDFQVTVLQEGKRFSSRHVRAAQGNGRTVLDAQVSCAVPLDGPAHAVPSTSPAGERPEALATLEEVDPTLIHRFAQLGGYSSDRKPSIEFRIPEPSQQLSSIGAGGRFRFWMRTTKPLPDDVRIHAAAFAYLSDWWLNFIALGPYLRDMGARKLYISSLNHALWLHRPLRADQWMHVASTSPCAEAGRGLAIGTVHDLQGRPLASLTQECLMAYAD